MVQQVRGKRNLLGMRFGRLEVLEQVLCERVSGRTDIKWKCRCDCGNVKDIYTHCLVREKQPTVSCGCYHVDNKTVHGYSKTSEYKSYKDMLRRCLDEESQDFHNYGGRGIQVCENWKASFINFYNDLGVRPKGFSLERVDVNGDYEPENCLWVDPLTQAANKRKSSKNTSGRTGVSWDKSKDVWVACISRDSVVYKLGTFKDFVEACKVREQAELEYFGFIKE